MCIRDRRRVSRQTVARRSPRALSCARHAAGRSACVLRAQLPHRRGHGAVRRRCVPTPRPARWPMGVAVVGVDLRAVVRAPPRPAHGGARRPPCGGRAASLGRQPVSSSLALALGFSFSCSLTCAWLRRPHASAPRSASPPQRPGAPVCAKGRDLIAPDAPVVLWPPPRPSRPFASRRARAALRHVPLARSTATTAFTFRLPGGARVGSAPCPTWLDVAFPGGPARLCETRAPAWSIRARRWFCGLRPNRRARLRHGASARLCACLLYTS